MLTTAFPFHAWVLASRWEIATSLVQPVTWRIAGTSLTENKLFYLRFIKLYINKYNRDLLNLASLRTLSSDPHFKSFVRLFMILGLTTYLIRSVAIICKSISLARINRNTCSVNERLRKIFHQDC